MQKCEECFMENTTPYQTVQDTHLFQKNSFIHILINNPKISIKHPKSVHIKVNTMYNYSKFKL